MEPDIIPGEESDKRPKLTETDTSKESALVPSLTPQLHHNGSQSTENGTVRFCPYLDTVNRSILDFDFEKKCSVTLSTVNVYCCLVCGKYFQGRKFNTPAGQHSVEEDHHVFVNLQNRKIYCLPEDYEVFDSSLADIQVRLFNSSFILIATYLSLFRLLIRS